MIIKLFSVIRLYKFTFFILIILFVCNSTFAQKRRVLEGTKQNTDTSGINQASPQQPTPAEDAIGGFKHRDDLADSINISYRYLDSSRSIRIDSSLNDFNRHYSVPANYVTLGKCSLPGSFYSSAESRMGRRFPRF